MACVEDTTSVSLTINLTTGALEASLLISEDPENIAAVHADGLFVGATALTIPIGCVVPFAGGSAPTGWLFCDGSAVSRSTYSNLFSVISVTYGTGDGSTTFNVPDLRGRVVVGLNAANADVATMADSDGLAAASRSPKHNSTISPNPHSHTGGFVSSGAGAGGGVSGTGSPASTDPTTLTVGPGGSRPVDTPAFLVLNNIIKV